MTPEELKKQAKRIIDSGRGGRKNAGTGALAEALEFLRVYAGEKSAFYKHLSKVDQTWSGDYIMEYLQANLEGFIRYVDSGLLEGISIERKAQIDVVSDFLDQANILLNSKDVHPAAPTVIIGAALEEFLRNWIEETGLSLSGKKPSIESYANVLKEAELITKQDGKDITAWSGLRNHAAHGEWDEIKDKSRVYIMLEGVNLFMRKYGEKAT